MNNTDAGVTTMMCIRINELPNIENLSILHCQNNLGELLTLLKIILYSWKFKYAFIKK